MTIHIIGGCDFREWVRSRIPVIRHPFPDNSTCIGFGNDERLLGAVVYTDYNGYNIHATIAVEPDCKWASPRVIKSIFSYPFVACKCERITCLIAKSNKKSRLLCESLGFKYEGNMRKGFQTEDMLAYGMLREEAEELGLI